MRQRDDVLGYLAKTSLFSACSRRDLGHVAKHSDRVTVAAGRVLTEEGTTGHEFYVILDGKVAVERGGREVATLGPGDSFGELALLDRAPRNATVTAVTDAEVLIMGQREFTAALDIVPTLAHKLLIGLARRMHQVDAAAVN